jgi:hypothetical protein
MSCEVTWKHRANLYNNFRWHLKCMKRVQPLKDELPRLDPITNKWIPDGDTSVPGKKPREKGGKLYCPGCFEKLKSLAAKF